MVLGVRKIIDNRRIAKNRERVRLHRVWDNLLENGLFLEVEGNKEILKTQKLLKSLGFLAEGPEDAILNWVGNFSDKSIIMYTKPYTRPKYTATRLDVFRIQDKQGQLETSLAELEALNRYGFKVS